MEKILIFFENQPSVFVSVGALLLLSLIVFILVKFIFIKAFIKIIKKTKTTWDDAFLDTRFLKLISYLAPLIVLLAGQKKVFLKFPTVLFFLEKIVSILIIVLVSTIVSILFSTFYKIFEESKYSKELTLKGVFQVLKLINIFVASIFVISVALNKSPVYFLSGLGALTAVLLLVFKDSILGLISGIQLSANKMIRNGDWIEMPKYGADGEVEDVTLNTVKVRNWDKTVTTIPTYSLVSDSFKNWRGMTESGGRRMKRSLFIDLNSIEFCTDELLENLKKVSLLGNYLIEIHEEIEKYNLEQSDHIINKRSLTNVGIFRKYINLYLEKNEHIHQEMTKIVRQLPPKETGLPIEIYVFIKETSWKAFEDIQSDIFDHFISIVPEFGLRLFQVPSGEDFRFFKK
jgi:miniconductance mechanosensitive channel